MSNPGNLTGRTRSGFAPVRRRNIQARTRSEAQVGVQRRAHEYLRVSVDGSGVKESESEQHEDNERTRLEEGWARGRTYQDTGSASRYARKTRDDFGKLLTDLRTGVFRRDNEVRLHVTSHRRLYDLNNPRDRRTLNEDGVDSAYESAKTSMRIRRHLPETPVPWWGTAPSATNSPNGTLASNQLRGNPR
jgi:hypothetical protein